MSDTGWQLNADDQSISGWSATAHRYFYGTQSASLAQGCISAMDLMDDIGTAVVQQRILQLSDHLTRSLLEADLPIDLLSAEEESSRSGMVGFRHNTDDYQENFNRALQSGFRIRMVPESGLDSLRISTHIYNNENELDGFVAFLKELD